MNKERYSNLTCSDTVNLKLFTFNVNNLSDVQSINNINIYQLIEHEQKQLIQTIAGSSVNLLKTGIYELPLFLDPSLYSEGNFQDSWNISFTSNTCENAVIVDNSFKIYPDKWFSTPFPPIYDFSFRFYPNKIRFGSKRNLVIDIIPNVPHGSDILPYYIDLATVSDIRINIELECGRCVPKERDLRLIVDNELVHNRNGRQALYFIDTNEFEEGLYSIWFEVCFGENLFISPKESLQIF